MADRGGHGLPPLPRWLAGVLAVFLLVPAGVGLGALSRHLTLPARPVATGPSLPEYSPRRAADTVEAYYGNLASGDYAGAWERLMPGTAGEESTTTGLMAGAGMTASLGASLSPEAFPAKRPGADGRSYWDLSSIATGTLSVGTVAERGIAPQAWLVWNSRDGSYLIADRLVPLASSRTKADVYLLRSGKTTVRLQPGTIYRTPWLAYFRIDYRDTGSTGAPMVLSEETTSTTGLRVAWHTASLRWNKPHSMWATVVLVGAMGSVADPRPLVIAPLRLPLMVTRSDRNLMPVVKLP